ncbi:hypothetical protein ACIRQY_29050 [Streptomyces sp. NPDC101490]|uniref:hypothetical protein n=1 Tax=Streptomyces sp. NPDC101490 TaxID=3366143 RepID=UPI00380A4E09
MTTVALAAVLSQALVMLVLAVLVGVMATRLMPPRPVAVPDAVTAPDASGAPTSRGRLHPATAWPRAG